MIADERLLELFRLESTDYLQRLDDGLLRLEREPDDASVEALFRAAHSLKGAAHMLGLDTVELLAHSLEDMLNAARREADARSPAHVQEMLRQLADIRAALAETLAPAAALHDAPQAVQTESPAAAPAPFGLDAVRVESGRLDALLNCAGELTVAWTRVSRRLADLDALIDYCEEFRREAAVGHCADPAHRLALFEAFAPIDAMLARLRAALDDDCARLDAVSAQLNDGIREIRLLPLANIFRPFPRMVQELARSQGKSVELVIEGEEAGADKRILEEIRDPLIHLLRNAVDHGIEPADERKRAGKPAAGRIRLRAQRSESAIEIEVSDDGRGLDEAAIRRAALQGGLESEAALAAMAPHRLRSLIFRPGLTTAQCVTDVSGRGIGLDVVRERVERLKGTLALESVPGQGVRFRLRLPVSLVTARILIVEVDGCPYGLPVEQVIGSRKLAADEILQLEGREAMLFDDLPIPLGALGGLLERPAPRRDAGGEESRIAVVLATVAGRFAVLVDALLDEQEVVLKPLSGVIEEVRNLSAATILDNGAICLVLNPLDLIGAVGRQPARADAVQGASAPARKKRILLAEDSITTRTQENRILTAAGYDVVTAVDGFDALQKLVRGDFDAVVTDVNMPRLDGLELARRLRCEARHAALPIILVTSLASDEDRRRGLEAGASAYITKPGFDQRELIECLERLV